MQSVMNKKQDEKLIDIESKLDILSKQFEEFLNENKLLKNIIDENIYLKS